MNSSKLLTLILSSDKQPFFEIRVHGQGPTWVTQAENDGFRVLAYTSTGDGNEELSREITRLHNIEEAINRTPLHRIRPIRSSPGRLSSKVNLASDRAKLEVSAAGNLVDDLGDGLPLIGARTIRAFEFALANYQFDFLARTNTSSYLDVQRLADQLPDEAKRGTIYALTGKWGRFPYPSGALYVMSREDIKEIVANQDKWIHEYIDDVALGLLAKKIFGNLSYVPIERFDFPFDTGTADPEASPCFVHYRCKSPHSDVTVSRLLQVHTTKRNHR